MKTIFFDVDGLAANVPGFAENILTPLQEDPDLTIMFFSISKRDIAIQRLKDNHVEVDESMVFGFEDQQTLYHAASMAAEQGRVDTLKRTIEEEFGSDPDKHTDEQLIQLSKTWIRLSTENYFNYKNPSFLYWYDQENPPLLVESDSALQDLQSLELRRDRGMQLYPSVGKELGFSVVLTPDAPTAWSRDPQKFTNELLSTLRAWNGQLMHRDLGKEHNLYPQEGQPPRLGLPKRPGKER